MKLNEIDTDKALDVLCDLTVPLTKIAEDKELIKAVYKRTLIDEKTSQEEKKILGTVQVAKNLKVIVPKLLKAHRQEVYEVLSIVNEKDINEIKKQSLVETVKQIKELVKDEELTSFFQSLLS